MGNSTVTVDEFATDRKQTLLDRWLRAQAVSDRIAAELLATLGEKPRRAANGTSEPGDRARVLRVPALDLMHKRGQLSDRHWLAGREIGTLLDAIDIARGLRSSMASAGATIDKPSFSSDGHVRLLHASQRWAKLQTAVLADRGCGANVETRKHVIPVLELVCGHGLTLNDIEAMKTHGRRDVLAKRLKAGLSVAVKYFGIRPDTRGIQVAHAAVDEADQVEPEQEMA